MNLEDFLDELEKNPPKYGMMFWPMYYLRQWRMLYRRPKWMWQRARRGYSEEDTWSFDFYLNGVIAGGVQRLKDRSIGHPGNITLEEWNIILDKIIKAFGHCAKKVCQHETLTDEEKAEMYDGMRLFVKWYFDLWD